LRLVLRSLPIGASHRDAVAELIASTWSCVTYTVVVLSGAGSFEISARICTRSSASRFDSGSSNRNTEGLRTNGAAECDALACRRTVPWACDRAEA